MRSVTIKFVRVVMPCWVIATLMGDLSTTRAAEYVVTRLVAPPGATAVTPSGLNDAAQVVGWVTFSGAGTRPFYWTQSGGVVVMPQPPESSIYAVAHDINNSGLIVGGDTASVGPAWYFVGGNYTPLNMPSGTTTADAWAVNDAGDAAGYGGSLSAFAYFFDNAAQQMLQLAPPLSRSTDINNFGQVTGYGPGDLGPSSLFAFRWKQTTGMQRLGPLSSHYSNTFGFGINAQGDVVGEASYPVLADDSRAFLFTDDSGMQMIPPIGFGLSTNQARRINDARAVVGVSTHTGFGDKGWIWTPTAGIRMLESLIDPNEHLTILAAYDINEHGQIAAYASDTIDPFGGPVGLLLTPIVQGDINGDGQVNSADTEIFVAVLLGFDTTPSHVSACDLNHDGFANGADTQEFVNAIVH